MLDQYVESNELKGQFKRQEKKNYTQQQPKQRKSEKLYPRSIYCLLFMNISIIHRKSKQLLFRLN